MRIAIISDIHSNLEALARTFELIEQYKADEVVCLGDIVGYGANPNECVTLIRSRTSRVIRGNHDDASVNFRRIEEFNSFARTVVVWTNKRLTDDNKNFLGSLPYTAELGGLLFAHSSPNKPEEWEYIFSPDDAEECFSAFAHPICFIGHTHYPGIFCDDIVSQEIVREKRFIVNVGSVGQPRDLNWKLSFGIFDTDTWKYSNIRSEYDVKTASEKIVAAGLPRALGERILIGR